MSIIDKLKAVKDHYRNRPPVQRRRPWWKLNIGNLKQAKRNAFRYRYGV